MKCKRFRMLAMVVCVLLIGSVVWAQPKAKGPAAPPPPGSRDMSYPVSGVKDGEIIEAYLMTRDGVYIPAAIRKPEASGPFPAIIFIHGGRGGVGMQRLRAELENPRAAMERMIAEGYVVVNADYRDFEDLKRGSVWETPQNPTDVTDLLDTIEFLKRQSYVDPARIGLFGVSHGGGLIVEAIAVADVAGAIANEPAAMNFLRLKIQGPSGGGELQLPEGGLPESAYDKAIAIENAKRIKTPLLIVDRKDDHLHQMFVKIYELTKEAGGPVEIDSYEDPRHGFSWGPSQKEGGTALSEAAKAAMDKMVKFFNQHVKKTKS